VESVDRFGGQDAVGPTAVGDHLGVLGELVEPVGQLVQGDRHGAGDVPGLVLLARAHVDHDQLVARVEAPTELGCVDRLERVAGLEVGADRLGDLAELGAGDLLDGLQQPAHGVVGDAVVDVSAVPTDRYQAGTSEFLELGGGGRHLEVGGPGQFLDRAFALAQQIEQLQPLGVAHDLADPSELLVEGVLDRASIHATTLGRSNDACNDRKWSAGGVHLALQHRRRGALSSAAHPAAWAGDGQPGPGGVFGRTVTIDYRTFAHLAADKRERYRQVLQAFAAAKARFVLHLRPSDVREAMVDPPAVDEVEAALRQLVAWGNLSADPDTAEVATVEEFYRARFLYRLTAEGEATERALEVFEEGLLRSGELQTAALGDIRDLLHELRDHLRPRAGDGTEPDLAKVHLTLRSLWHRFEELTDRAQGFVASLQRTVDLHGIDLEALLAYKDGLIEYLERFIGELVIAQAHIAELLRDLEHAGVERLLDAAAARELADALEPTDADHEAARETWRTRWAGLAGWFLPVGTRPAQAELLRNRARAAIPALLQAIAEVNERRLSRSDRAGDLRELARWFAACDSDAEAHRLWRAAFALAPARHLTVDHDTLLARDQCPVTPSTSWLDAPPVHISPRLRRTGRATRRGRVNDVIDRSQEKALLAELARREASQALAARRRLVTDGMTRLSALGTLDPVAFELFLDLLAAALAAAVHPHRPVIATTADGSLEIELGPADGHGLARVVTTDGVLSGPDRPVVIREARAVGIAS